MLSRRVFLAALAGTAAACASGDGGSPSVSATSSSTTTSSPASTSTAAPATAPLASPPATEITTDPFTLGVASGDPLSDRVILWTRLLPDSPALLSADQDVVWEVATDDTFTTVVSTGMAAASAELAHSVHVDADGLDADTWYVYRFRVGDHTSPVGRTRTLPSPDASPDSLRFAFASCQAYQDGYYAAHDHLAAEDIDLVFFLGDYIYEGGVDPDAVRQHEGPEPTTLETYRARYVTYKRDRSLQAAHASAPWILTWDDHEVENNYADRFSQDDAPTDEFLDRRAAAYQAYYEHLPLRVEAPVGPDLALYRDFVWGDLASFWVLDTRQERADQVCSFLPGLDAGLLPCPEREEPDRRMIGEEQEAWLTGGLAASTSVWNVIAQQVVLSPTPIRGSDVDPAALDAVGIPVGLLGDSLDGLEGFNADQWDGYPVQRQRILTALADTGSTNNVVVTGDIHASAMKPLRADADDPASAIVGIEFVGTSISAGGSGPTTDPALTVLDDAYAPNFDYFNREKRGYVYCEVDRDRWTTVYRTVESVEEPTSALSDDATFTVVAGEPGYAQGPTA